MHHQRSASFPRIALILALSAVAGCGIQQPPAGPPSPAPVVSPAQEEPAMWLKSGGKFDRRLVLGTDIASFNLYHPLDLEHRRTSPIAWTSYHFACRPEFEAGRLVAFDSGSDGGFGFRVTDGELTDRERQWRAGSWDFRYVVRHGRVYLDGGYSLPSDDYSDESAKNPDQWFELPNGNYRVTVTAIEWYSEPGALDENESATERALTSYVIQFRPVTDLESIEVSSTPPRLETSRESPAEASPSFAETETFADEPIELKDRYVVLVNREVAPIPGYHISMNVSDECYEAMYGSRGSQMLPDRIEELVIAVSDKAPCLGVIATPSGASKMNDGPWRASFHARRLVKIVGFEPTDPWETVRVAALDRPTATVPTERLDELKQAFVRYSKANAEYRKSVEHPDFEADRVVALDSATGVTHVLIHHIPLPLQTRLELLQLSDGERVDRLMDLLKR